jgi:hypothetical protein
MSNIPAKYNVIQKPKIFNDHFVKYMPTDLSLEAGDWKWILDIVPQFRTVVLKSGVDEAMDLYLSAHNIEPDNEKDEITAFSLLMLAYSFESEFNN